MGATAKVIAMAAGPATATARIPKGKSRKVSLPTLKWKFNVVTMDENAEVHLGPQVYPPWVRASNGITCMHAPRAPSPPPAPRDARQQPTPDHSRASATRMQMIKRLRATIYNIDMGQARMNVDEAVYELVRQKLADASLCGPHTLAQTPPLSQAPPPPEKPSHRKRQAEQQQQPPPKRPRVEIFQVEEIIAEEPPSREVWHRYLVRW
eukprot:7385007-Prymnesium_polylepis.1